MAITVPEEIPEQASEGERLLFSILEKLPKNCIVYYDPRIDQMKPDFTVIIPEMGLLTIEVKSWQLDDIQTADKQTVMIKDRSGLGNNPHPTAMGRNYKMTLLEFCRRHPGLENLFYQDGPREGNLALPFGHVGVLSRIQGTQFVRHARAGFWRDVFPPAEIVTRDTIELWRKLDMLELFEKFKVFFVPSWPVALQREHVTSLRAAIHPEIAINTFDRHSMPERQWTYDLKVLDIRQERSARWLGSGHRVLYGLVGSGKTAVLIGRARALAYARPRSRILFLCYSLHQATLLQAALSELEHAVVMHFHGWAASHGVEVQPGEGNIALGQRLYDAFEAMGNRAPRFDAVLVDQAQDFAPEWFHCIVRSLAYPLDGDLLVSGDGNQRLENVDRPWTWADAGLRIAPRVAESTLDLDWNYRNTTEIMGIASLFATSTSLGSDDAASAVPSGARSLPIRSTGLSPQILRCSDRAHECRKAAQLARELVAGRWIGQGVPPLRPEQISIIYPFETDETRPYLEKLVVELKDLNAVWLDRLRDDGSSPIREQGTKIQSIRASRGVGYAASILIFMDQLPREAVSETLENRLMYVALTRPSDYLAVVCSGDSKFIDRIMYGPEH